MKKTEKQPVLTQKNVSKRCVMRELWKDVAWHLIRLADCPVRSGQNGKPGRPDRPGYSVVEFERRGFVAVRMNEIIQLSAKIERTPARCCVQ
jgi:hypothetical protein